MEARGHPDGSKNTSNGMAKPRAFREAMTEAVHDGLKPTVGQGRQGEFLGDVLTDESQNTFGPNFRGWEG